MSQEGDVPLGAFALPTRMKNFLRRRGVTTLRGLLALAPAALALEPNIGRRSIDQTRRAIAPCILGRCGDGAVIRQGPEPAPVPVPEPPEIEGGSLPLDALALPGRMVHWAAARGIATLRQLSWIHPEVLRRQPNVGRKTFEATRAILEARLGARWEDVAQPLPAPLPEPEPALEPYAKAPDPGPEDVARTAELVAAGFLEGLAMLSEGMPDGPRRALRLRLGLDGVPWQAGKTKKLLGVVYVKALRLVRAAAILLRRERGWMAAVRERTQAVLADGAIPLSALADDPWWAAMTKAPDALDWFGDRVLGDLFVVVVDGVPCAARVPQRIVDEAWQALHRGAARVPLPAPPHVFHALLDPWVSRLGPALTTVLLNRIDEKLWVEGTAEHARVTHFGLTRREQTRALLEASPRPLSLHELDARLGHRELPEEVLSFGSGVVGLERHFPDFAAWRERVVPAAIRLMKKGRAGRQWLHGEIHEALAGALGLPSWLGPWHVGSLLRQSGEIRALGQWRFALAGARGSDKRIAYQHELVRILREAGAPMSRADLHRALAEKMSVHPTSFAFFLGKPPLLRCGRGRYGLLERDLPGGEQALAVAATHMAAVLERRGRWLPAAEVRAEVKRLGPDHARWTPEMCLSALNVDARFLRPVGGDTIGLATWKDKPAPTRRAVLEACLDKGGGRARARTVLEEIERIFKVTPSPAKFASWVWNCGLSMRGGWIARRTA